MYVRDVVLGVNDGLVSMFLLQTGAWNAGLNNRQTLLFGICGESGMCNIQNLSINDDVVIRSSLWSSNEAF